MVELPLHIHASRNGVNGTEYDVFGEQAPITWTCECGHRLQLESINWDTEQYVPVSQERKEMFLEDHKACKPETYTCYKCCKVEVEFFQGWCDPCAAKDDSL